MPPVPADGPAPPDLATRPGLQSALDSLDAGKPPRRATLALPPGTVRLDRPLWLDRDGVHLDGQGVASLQAAGGFPAVVAGLKRPPAGWEAVHTTPLPDTPGRFGWDFRGDSYLIFRGTPFDLGPLGPSYPATPDRPAGPPDAWASPLAGWAAVRVLTIRLTVSRTPGPWTRQGLLTLHGFFDGTQPDPWQLTCPSDGRLRIRGRTDGGPINLEWAVPDDARLVLEVALDLDAGTASIAQNGRPPARVHHADIPRGSHFLPAEAPEFRVGSGQGGDAEAGTFALESLDISTDGRPLASLAPLPAASGMDGLWRWAAPQGVWGYGLLRPAKTSDFDAIDDTGLRDLSVRCPDSQPYGVGVLIGQALEFTADRCRFSCGARGVDQVRSGVPAYVTRVRDCRFLWQKHACVNLDYGDATLSGLRLEGSRAPYLIRTRATDATIRDCFFVGRPGVASAIRLAETARVTIDACRLDFEDRQNDPDHLIHASLGRTNGGASLVTIRDTPASGCRDTPVLLDDQWGGTGGVGVGPGKLMIDNSLRLFLPDTAPAPVRIGGADGSVGAGGGVGAAGAGVTPGWVAEEVGSGVGTQGGRDGSAWGKPLVAAPAAPPVDPPGPVDPTTPTTPTIPATGPNAPLPADILALPLFGGPWDTPVDGRPAHPDSAAMIAHYPAGKGLNPVFGFDWGGYPQGIPYNVVDASVPLVPITCQPPASWDVKPYTIPAPIPPDWPVVRQSPPDSHLLILCKDRRMLWEFWGTKAPDDPGNPTPGRWHATSGVAWDLTETHAAQHAEGRTSADAAGLPILPGVLAYDRLMGGTQKALRVSVPNNGNTPGWYKLPAHTTANANDSKPFPVPFGARIRLRADFDRSSFPPGSQSRAILDTLARYGGIVADGTDGDQGWTIDGVPDPRWRYDGDLVRLRDVPATALEVVDDGLWGVAWDVQVSPGPYKVGQPITITGRLLGPPPTTGQLELIPYPIPPSGRPGYMPTDPYRMLRPDPDRGAAWDKPGVMTLVPKEAGAWKVNWQSQAGGNRGRRAPDGNVVQVGD